MPLGHCKCGIDLDALVASGKIGHVCTFYQPLRFKWECALCDATSDDVPWLRCRVIYVHGAPDSVVCENCDKGADVIDNVVRRALLREKLTRELLEENDDSERSAAERAYRKGWNDRARALIKELT